MSDLAAQSLLHSLGLGSVCELPRDPPALLRQPFDNAQSYFGRLRARVVSAASDDDLDAALEAGLWALCQFMQHDMTG
jgi:hypothetical protein